MRRWTNILLLLVIAVGSVQWWQAREESVSPAAGDQPAFEAQEGRAPSATQRDASPYPTFLPPEAITTLGLIERGGPFPYARDGSVFQNRERRLPEMPRGYYLEYTVRTPGSPGRGARRIVSGGDPPVVYYYTDDHYRTFRRVEVPP